MANGALPVHRRLGTRYLQPGLSACRAAFIWPRRGFGAEGRPGARIGERGQALVFVLFGVLVIVAAGLVIDGGRTFEERRSAQTAADQAATAAAYTSCVGGDDATARAAGHLAANRNGYDDATGPIVVTVDPVVGQASAFKAAVSSTIPSTFARLLGISTFTISVEATAGGVGCGAAPGAVFAGGTCPAGAWGFDVSGSDNEIYGGIHTNANASTSGSNNRFFAPGDPDDPFTYVGVLQNSGSNNLFQSPAYPRNDTPQAWPTDWAPTEIDADLLLAYETLALANGADPSNDTYFTTAVTDITKDGVYYTTSEDGMDISNIVWSADDDRTVVLLAPNGPIKISVSTPGRTLRALSDPGLPRDGLLMLSNEQFPVGNQCSKYAINVSGQAATWVGTMWAPGGLIELAGSDGSAIDGSLIGWAVRVNGQLIDIANDSADADPSVVLLR